MKPPAPNLSEPSTILAAVGALKHCAVHDAYVWDLGAVEDAYRLANTMMTREVGYGSDQRREVTDAIKQTYDDAPMECFDCSNPNS